VVVGHEIIQLQHREHRLGKLSAPRVRSISLSLMAVLADASLTHMPTLDGPACQLRNDSAINNSRQPDLAGRPIFGMRVNILLASTRPFDERQRQPCVTPSASGFQ